MMANIGLICFTHIMHLFIYSIVISLQRNFFCSVGFISVRVAGMVENGLKLPNKGIFTSFFAIK